MSVIPKVSGIKLSVSNLKCGNESKNRQQGHFITTLRPSKKYFKNNFLPKKPNLEEWLAQATLQDMKGLRIISAVLKHKGQKKFRTLRPDMAASQPSIVSNMNKTNKMPLEELLMKIKSNNKDLLQKARLEYSREKFKSNYGIFFGRKPDLTDYKDMNILKFKKFSELKSSKIFNKKTLEFLDKWQEIKEHPDYLGMALYTMKALFTYFKICEPNTTTQRAIHIPCEDSERIKPERYDKIMDKILKTMKLKNIKNTSRKRQIEGEGKREIIKGNFMRKFHKNPMNMTKANTHLKSTTNFLGQCAVPEPLMSSYQKTFKGFRNTNHVGNLKGYFSTSCMAGGIIPDPNMMKTQTLKAQKLKND